MARIERAERSSAVPGEQKAGDQRRQENAQQIRCRRAAQRRRHVAARHRGEGDRGLHRRGQRGEQDQAGPQRSGSRLGASQCAVIPSSGNSAKVLRNTIEMQPPVPRADEGRFRRKLGAVHEEQAARWRHRSASRRPTAASPRAGIREARATVSRMAARNGSMRDQTERAKPW